MVHSRSKQLDETFFALSDPTRRALLSRLAEAATWVETYRQFWEQSFDRLEAYLETIKTKKSNKEK